MTPDTIIRTELRLLLFTFHLSGAGHLSAKRMHRSGVHVGSLLFLQTSRFGSHSSRFYGEDAVYVEQYIVLMCQCVNVNVPWIM